MSTNPYRDSTAGDYLDKVRKHMLENRAGNTSSGSFTPNYIIPVTETVTTTDAFSQDPNRKTVAESVTCTDSCSATGYTTGNFTVAHKDDGSDQSAPIKCEFWDVGL